jgi:hypothetical protein
MPRKLIILSVLIAAVGCGARQAPVEDVDKAAALFFQRFNDGQYTKIIDDGAANLKKANRQEVMNTLQSLAANGKIERYSRVSMALPVKDNERQAHPLYSVQTDLIMADFKLIFVDEGGEWKLLSFEHKPRQVIGRPQ